MSDQYPVWEFGQVFCLVTVHPAPPCFAHFWRPGSLEALCFKHTKVRSLIAPISLELMLKTCVDEEYATQVVLPSRGKMIPCIFRDSQLEPVIKCWNSIFYMNFLLFSSPVYLFVPLRLSLFPYKRRAQHHNPPKLDDLSLALGRSVPVSEAKTRRGLTPKEEEPKSKLDNSQKNQTGKRKKAAKERGLEELSNGFG